LLIKKLNPKFVLISDHKNVVSDAVNKLDPEQCPNTELLELAITEFLLLIMDINHSSVTYPLQIKCILILPA